MSAEIVGNNLLAVAGTENHPANFGRLCVKGAALADSLAADSRLLHPVLNGRRVDWDIALDEVAMRFRKTIEQHGPDSVAFYLSGQLLTEDYYVANKLMKGFIGSGNVDTNSRLCMASAVSAYKRAFGADAVPCSYEDLELADLIILVGSNAAWTHPVLYQRMLAAKQNRPQMKIVVVDPRYTASCELADLHLSLQPGSDAFLFNGLYNYLLGEGLIDQTFIENHCVEFEATCKSSAQLNIQRVAEITGIEEELIQQFYDLFANTEKTVSFYSQGVNQSATGTDKCNAIINCHLLTGRLGYPGSGPFSITGQPNAMGGREVGGLATQLAAHMDFTPENVNRLQRFWKSENVADKQGLRAVELFEAMDRGEVKAIWIMATNPAVSLPDSRLVRRALSRCDFVVVSDCMLNTDTNNYANVLLPAAGWGEKDGTVTNSERRVSRQRQLLPFAGEARPDWQILTEVAQRMGFSAAFDYKNARDVFVEHAALSGFENDGQRAFDISALSQLDATGYDELQPLQWPINNKFPAGRKRLFEDRLFFTPDKKARFVPVEAKLPATKISSRFPLTLNTGRLRDQWHTMTRTGTNPKLLTHKDRVSVTLNQATMDNYAIAEGDLVRISSAQGNVTLPVERDDRMQNGHVFIPIHWTDQFSRNACVSNLLSNRVDSVSGQPESKFEHVLLETIETAAWSSVVCTTELDCQHFDYWLKVPVHGGVRYEIAEFKSSKSGKLENLISALKVKLPGTHCIEFRNESSNEIRQLWHVNGEVQGAMFSGKELSCLPDPSFLNSLLEKREPTPWMLLAGEYYNQEDKGPQICSCYEVGAATISKAIAEGCDSIEALGEKLRCGTNCGSCIPELKSLLRETALGSAVEAKKARID